MHVDMHGCVSSNKSSVKYSFLFYDYISIRQLLYIFLQALIDYLKFDIESSEWKAIPNMVNTGVLRNVKQIGFEIHTPGHSSTEVYDLIELLVQKGFRKWHFHFNPACSFTIMKLGLKSSKCIELYFINTHFLDSKLTAEGLQNTSISNKVK